MAIGWGYCYSVLAMWYWQCGIGIVSMMGWAAGAIKGGRRGLRAGPGWGFIRWPPGVGVAEKEAGRAGEGRLIYHARSLAPLNIREKPVCGMPVLTAGERRGARALRCKGILQFRKAYFATFITPQGDAVRGKQQRLDTAGTTGNQLLPLDAGSWPCVLAVGLWAGTVVSVWLMRGSGIVKSSRQK